MIALFFDTETTGFKSSTFTPEIVQIGALLQDTETKRVLAELNVIVTPNNPIPEVVSNIHGITDDIAARHGVPQIIAETAFTHLAKLADVVVAHNIAFDLGIIHDVWPMASQHLENREQFCTMRKATDVCKLPPAKHYSGHVGKHKPPKLVEAYTYFFDQPFDNAHDAMADVRACRDVYFKLLEQL